MHRMQVSCLSAHRYLLVTLLKTRYRCMIALKGIIIMVDQIFKEGTKEVPSWWYSRCSPQQLTTNLKSAEALTLSPNTKHVPERTRLPSCSNPVAPTTTKENIQTILAHFPGDTSSSRDFCTMSHRIWTSITAKTCWQRPRTRSLNTLTPGRTRPRRS